MKDTKNDKIFIALSNTYRREIIFLLKSGSKSAGDIVKNFDISQPSISRHLDILKKSKIISANRVGNQIIYTLNPQTIENLLFYCAKMFPSTYEGN